MATNDALTNFALYVASLRDTKGEECRVDPASMLNEVIKRARAVLDMPPAGQREEASSTSPSEGTSPILSHAPHT